MGAADARELINLWPAINGVEPRGGYTQHATLDSNTGVQSDGTNYLDGGDIAAFDFGASQDFTIEMRVSYTTSTGTKRLIGKYGGSSGWYLNLDISNGQIGIGTGNGTTVSVVFGLTETVPGDGESHHLACVFDKTANTATVYTDGVLTAGPASVESGSYDSGTTPFRICADNSAANVFTGTVDDVRIWSDKRTQSEISSNKDQELTGSEANLIGYWKMNGSVGATVSTVSDETVGANTLTSTGAGSMTYIDTAGDVSLTSYVDTVAEFFDGGTRRLVAATSDTVWNATSGAATSLGTGFTNGRWQTEIMNGVMGLVNGADAPQTYNGSTLSAMTVSGTTATELKGIHVFKSRSYFWKANSASFWYSAVNTLGGVLTEFALGQVVQSGGNLVSMTSWTVDGGSGPDDYAVFVMSTGETIVYQGSDPGSSTDWSLVGRYELPAPLDVRGVIKIGAEILVLTVGDIVFAPSSFRQPSPPKSKLSGAIEQAASQYKSNTGWDAVFYDAKNMLLLNIPVSPDTLEQYVVNLETGAPARFIGQNARSLCVYDDELYFGTTDGRVMKADNGFNDDGTDIECDAKQAYSDLGAPFNKTCPGFRFVFEDAIDSFMAGGEIAWDLRDEQPARSVTSGGAGTPWGSPWGSAWSASTGVIDDWESGDGEGQVMSPQLAFAVDGHRPRWVRTDLLIQRAPNI